MQEHSYPIIRTPLLWGAVAFAAVLLALVPWQYLGFGAALVLPIVHPVFGLYWVVLSVSVQDAVRLPGGLSYTQAAIMLALAGWGLRVLAYPERRIRLGWPAALWAGMLLALMLSTSLTPYSYTEALKECWRWASAFLVWLIAVNTLQKPWQVAGLLVCVLLGPLANAMLGLEQFLAGDGPPTFRIAADLPYVRAYGTFGQPNSFAAYMNLAWPVALSLAVGATAAVWPSLENKRTREQRTKNKVIPALKPYRFEQANKRTREQTMALGHPVTRSPGQERSPGHILLALCLWSVAGILLAALGASFSRGAWLGAGVGMLALLLALGGRAAWLGLAAIAGGALVLALGGAQVLPEVIAARLESITRAFVFFDPSAVQITDENFAVVERMAQIWAGFQMFVTYPLTGVGPGNYTSAYQDFAVAPWFASRGHAHNYYLHSAAEAGILGLLAYLALVGGMALLAARAARSVHSTYWRSVMVGSCGMIGAAAGHNLFENVHVLHLGIQIAAVWALPIVVLLLEPKKQ